MQALVLIQPGERPIFEFQKIALPKPDPNDVLIETHTVSLNPIDIKTAMGGGLYHDLKSELPLILGWDVAGIVVDKGKNVTSCAVGDRVFGMVNFPKLGRTLADYVCAPASHVTILPPQSSFIKGAACGLAALTAYQALVKYINLTSGMQILIHGASGGVGHFAVQIAQHLGASVWATCSATNIEFVSRCGAEKCIDYNEHDFESIDKLFDAVLDGVGFDYIDRSVKLLKPHGTLVSLPSISSHLIKKAVEPYRVRGVFFKVEPNSDHLYTLAAWMEMGILKPSIDKTYARQYAELAFDHVKNGHTQGKVVIQWKN